MSAPAFITALYPPAVRERWGGEISREVADRGPRSWFDAVAGALRLWLHPSDWPETTAGQTRRVLAVALFAVTAAATLLLRAAQPSPPLPADLRPIATGTWFVPIAIGLLLATPLPPLRRQILRDACRIMAAPAVIVAAMIALANSGTVDHPAGLVRAALLAFYWTTLGFTAVRVCALVARALRDGTVPTTRRLRGALLFVGTGTALAAGQNAVAVLRSPTGTGTAVATVLLALLAAVTLRTRQDLRSRSI